MTTTQGIERATYDRVTGLIVVVKRILELKAMGLTYPEIDQWLDLPRKSYRIMNGWRAKLIAQELCS